MSIGAVVGLASARIAQDSGGLTPVVERPSDLCQHDPPRESLRGALATATQNARVAASLTLGALTLGVNTVVQLAAIGFDVTTSYTAAAVQSRSRLFAIAALLPHGWLELSVFVSVGATGIGLTLLVWGAIHDRKYPARSWLRSLGLELLPFVLLLPLAAVVEEFVTPGVIRWSLGCQ